MTATWFDSSRLPTSWKTLPLRRVGRIVNGGTPTADPDNWDGQYPFVTPPDLNGADGAVIESTARTLSTAGTKAAGIVPAGSILVSTRAPIGHVGRVGTLSTFNQGCKAVTPNIGIDPGYIATVLVAARAELIARGQGATFFELSSAAFAAITIPLPPFDEQRAIADYLDQETAQIDALVAKQQEFIGLLRERRSAAIESAVAGVNLYGSRLKHLIRSLRQGWSPQCYSWPTDGVECWAVLKTGAVNGGVFRAMENKELPSSETPRPEIVVRAGDLVVSRANTRELVGSAAVVDRDYPKLMLSDKLYAYELDRRKALPRYVASVLGSRRWRGLIEIEATGASSSMLNISQDDIINLPLGLPTVQEQQSLLDVLDEQTLRIDALIAKAEEHIALAKERRSALITAAVTGQVDVRTAKKGARV